MLFHLLFDILAKYDALSWLRVFRYTSTRIIAAAITNIGLLLACLLPLVLCWYLLTRRVEPADDQAVAEVLLEDLVADRPLLLPRTDGVRAIGLRAERDVSRSPDDSDHADRST